MLHTCTVWYASEGILHKLRSMSWHRKHMYWEGCFWSWALPDWVITQELLLFIHPLLIMAYIHDVSKPLSSCVFLVLHPSQITEKSGFLKERMEQQCNLLRCISVMTVVYIMTGVNHDYYHHPSPISGQCIVAPGCSVVLRSVPPPGTMDCGTIQVDPSGPVWLSPR